MTISTNDGPARVAERIAGNHGLSVIPPVELQDFQPSSPLHCLILGLATEYNTSVRKLAAM